MNTGQTTQLNPGQITQLAKAMADTPEYRTFVASERSICCLRCAKVSWHPKDVEYQYCGNCHIAHSTMMAQELMREGMYEHYPGLCVTSEPHHRRDIGLDPWVFEKPSWWKRFMCSLDYHHCLTFHKAILMSSMFRIVFWKGHLVKPYHNAPHELLYRVWYANCVWCGEIFAISQKFLDELEEGPSVPWRAVGP